MPWLSRVKDIYVYDDMYPGLTGKSMYAGILCSSVTICIQWDSYHGLISWQFGVISVDNI